MVINLKILGAANNQIAVVANNIQEIMVVSYKGKYRLQMVLVSGRLYFLVDNNDVYDYNTEAAALVAKGLVDAQVDAALGSGAVGPKGDTGEQGIQGLPGEQGPKGDKGNTGDTGPKGDKGDTGDAGPKGDKGDAGTTRLGETQLDDSLIIDMADLEGKSVMALVHTNDTASLTITANKIDDTEEVTQAFSPDSVLRFESTGPGIIKVILRDGSWTITDINAIEAAYIKIVGTTPVQPLVVLNEY